MSLFHSAIVYPITVGRRATWPPGGLSHFCNPAEEHLHLFSRILRLLRHLCFAFLTRRGWIAVLNERARGKRARVVAHIPVLSTRGTEEPRNGALVQEVLGIRGIRTNALLLKFLEIIYLSKGKVDFFSILITISRDYQVISARFIQAIRARRTQPEIFYIPCPRNLKGKSLSLVCCTLTLSKR